MTVGKPAECPERDILLAAEVLGVDGKVEIKIVSVALAGKAKKPFNIHTKKNKDLFEEKYLYEIFVSIIGKNSELNNSLMTRLYDILKYCLAWRKDFVHRIDPAPVLVPLETRVFSIKACLFDSQG